MAGFDLVKGLRARHLAVDHLNNVEAVLRLDQVRNGAFGQAEGGGLKFRDRLSSDDPAQVPALILARVFGVLLGQVGEIRAMLGLIEDILGLFLDLGNLGIGLADGLEENVGDMRTVLHLVLVDVGLVIDLFFVLGHLGALLELREVQQGIIHGPALGNHVSRPCSFRSMRPGRRRRLPLWIADRPA